MTDTGVKSRETASPAHIKTIAWFNPMLLGFGIYLGWCTCSPMIVNFVSAYHGPAIQKFVIEALLLIALALFANFKRRDLFSKNFLIMSVAVASISPLFEMANRLWLGTSVFGVITSVLSDAFGAWGIVSFYLLWHEQYARRPQQSAWVGYSVSFILEPVIYFVNLALPQTVSVLLVCCLPLISGFMLLLCAREDVFGLAEPKEPKGTWRFPWKPAILMMVFSFAYYMLMHVLGGASAIGKFGSLSCAVVVLIACTFIFSWFKAKHLYMVALPLMVCALLSFAQEVWDLSGVGSFFAYAGFTGFTLFLNFALNEICFRYGVQAAWLFGIVNACNVIAHMAGSLLGSAFTTASVNDPAIFNVIIYLIVIAIVVFGLLLVSTDAPSTTWTVTAHLAAPEPIFNEEASEELLEDLNKPQNPYISESSNTPPTGAEIEKRCLEVARTCGLTRREEEILSLIVEGKVAADIEAMLYISHNTCKGHIRHIYTKLDVHSREEAISLVLAK